MVAHNLITPGSQDSQSSKILEDVLNTTILHRQPAPSVLATETARKNETGSHWSQSLHTSASNGDATTIPKPQSSTMLIPAGGACQGSMIPDSIKKGGSGGGGKGGSSSGKGGSHGGSSKGGKPSSGGGGGRVPGAVAPLTPPPRPQSNETGISVSGAITSGAGRTHGTSTTGAIVAVAVSVATVLVNRHVN